MNWENKVIFFIEEFWASMLTSSEKIFYRAIPNFVITIVNDNNLCNNASIQVATSVHYLELERKICNLSDRGSFRYCGHIVTEVTMLDSVSSSTRCIDIKIICKNRLTISNLVPAKTSLVHLEDNRTI